ncbi:hypothetical protein TVAG_453130 [Trichomonas vaginalis G3]|uniref:Uncharacterized protein n=1 Tax=Trichomonas vaginalis (strain ATCC PRA-98 / G3) TaxID=412133 RepID=A2ES59_TRIV3|nr:hypothetical protein TVAGG3_0612270 [Trichomonas vaginalis G3]EAY04496.1 hypothetical protein TVAG_453130 [Trichomonas vaginalis G3]KAI5503279.1 hypothetical protein TVAGG3_0612270 [Trichomonas vaginalis G3]|eukprot:XP_001316719.1 hypothetical protein [Trichomonas vaginalis G3]
MSGDKCVSLLCNGTNNYGKSGSGLITIFDSKPDTFMKFIKVYKCFDFFFIEFVRTNYTASFCDFVEASGHSHSYCVDSCIATFENCLFIDSLNKEAYLVGPYQVKFINCSSNENRPDMTFTSLEKYDYQTTFSYNQVSCFQVKCTRLVNPGAIYYAPLFEIITIQ